MELVISHFEGCSGNFIGFLYANVDLENQGVFRTDGVRNTTMIHADGRNNWREEVARVENHKVFVSHQFDKQLIAESFPSQRHIAIWPYTRMLNVIWNVSFKKLPKNDMNQIDYHFINIKEWHNKLNSMIPPYQCYDYGQLNNQTYVEEMLKIQLSEVQKNYFKKYWDNQLDKDLNWPNKPMSIANLIEWYDVGDSPSDWYVALVLYTFETLHGIEEHQRRWSIDDINSSSWDNVVNLQQKYYIL